MSANDPAGDVRLSGGELTLRAILLGGLITMLFTAANVYLGLKVGLTFATSIPAAVVSIAVLRHFRGSNILENNIVQTIASAAGTLAAIIFVLPGLVIVGWWSGFPYVTTAAITMLGGILGVLFSVPLRRALVVGGGLPYPEGVAAAEVLKIGSTTAIGVEESRQGLRLLIHGSAVSMGFAVLTQLKLAATEAASWFRIGAGASGIAGGFSFALLGVGHLVGLSVGMAQLLGLLTAWAVLVPLLTAQQVPLGDIELWATSVFRDDVRFFGAGVIGVAAVWTLLKIAGPVVGGIQSAMAAQRVRRAGGILEQQERDIPIALVVGGAIALLVPIGWLLHSLVAGGPLAGWTWSLVVGAVLFIVVLGILIAAVCGYMAGLIGSSNSPISAVGILAILAAALMLAGLFGRDNGPEVQQALVAYALIVTSVVFGVATISNDNLQDLKTGHLVGATPWRQQVALIIGVVFGSLIVPSVLDLLNTAFGFVGAPSAGPNALSAPQAGLISALAKGVLGGDLNWPMIQYGAAAGVGFILLDELMGRAKLLRFPPLAVGIGIYLPMAVILPVVVGAVLGWGYNRWAHRTRDPGLAERMGILAATGLIVGESLWGVAFAGIVATSGSDQPLAIAPGAFEPFAAASGLVIFTALTIWLYRATMQRSR